MQCITYERQKSMDGLYGVCPYCGHVQLLQLSATLMAVAGPTHPTGELDCWSGSAGQVRDRICAREKPPQCFLVNESED